jgi:hypothetical protein
MSSVPSFTDGSRNSISYSAHRWGRLGAAAAIILSFVLSAPLSAQPSLNVKRAIVHWPTVELYFNVACNGTPVYNLSKQDFAILENGAPVPNFTMWCPDPTIRCAISVSLVFDASGSMAGAGNVGAKQAGHAFIDKMDGVVDEAAILWFASPYGVNVAQQMTTIKPMLHSAVDGLPASGGTPAWDGIYAGIVELINNGVNPCRALIALSDGADNASTRTVAEIIDLAQRHRIRVFTVALGAATNSAELEQIALLTGGRFYQTPNAQQIPAIFTEIYDMISTFNLAECIITYEPGCADGALHTVELRVNNFCGGSDSKVETYRAPLDSTTFTNLVLNVPDTWTLGGSQVSVPLNLVTALNGENLYPFSFTVRTDTTCMRLEGIAVPPGSLLDGVPLTVMPVSGGLHVNVLERVLVNGSGKMLDLSFRVPSVQDTTCCNVEITDVAFTEGCFLPVVIPGQVCFRPPISEAWTCVIDVPEITVDTTNDEYVPMPFDVGVTVTNIGPDPVDSLTAEIQIHLSPLSADLDFAAPDNPGTAIKPVVPSALAPGQSGTVSWRLQHPETALPRSYTIRVVVRTPSDSSDCQSMVFIPTVQLPPFSFDLTVEGSLNICKGQHVTLDAGPDYATYLWSTGATTRKITVTQTGDYYCAVTRPDGRPGVSRTVHVTVYEVPKIMFGVMGTSLFCEGDSVELVANAGYLSYLWSTGETTRSIFARQSGLYWVAARTMDSCLTYSDTVGLQTMSAPAKPVISRISDFLTTTLTTKYQWYLDGTELPGDTNQYLQLLQTGRYRVRITGPNGCTALSDEYLVAVLSAGSLPAVVRGFDVYPDPTDGGVTVDLRLARAEDVTIIVNDALGREVARYGSGAPVREFSRRITLGSTPGAYFLRVSAGPESWVRRVMKMR